MPSRLFGAQMSQNLPEITLDDLKSSPWVEIINRSPNKLCLEYFSEFCKEAEKYEEGSSESRAFKLLANLCSMDFSHDDFEQPFIPCWSSERDHSFLPEDLSDNNIEALFNFLAIVDDPELKSRIADTIWLKKGKHKFESAKIAFDEYMNKIEQIKGKYDIEAIIRICRAINMTHEMGRGGIELQKKIVSLAEKFLLDAPVESSFGYHARLFKILAQRGYGDLPKLIGKCNDIVSYLNTNNDFHLMRIYLRVIYDFIKRDSIDIDHLKDIKIKEAESYIDEAENADSATKRAIFIECAINAYRNIADCSDKVKELHAKLLAAQQDTINERVMFRTQEIDITDLTIEAEQFISGYDFYESLVRLAFIYSLPDEAKERAKTVSVIKNNPLHHIAAKRFTNKKGKTVGKVGPIDFSNLSENSDIVTAEMIYNLSVNFNFAVASRIIPALGVINSEHSITLDKLIDLVSNNLFVPQGRELLFARGLLAGFNWDFVTASLYLIPQIENSIRHILELNGFVITSTLSSTGIQKEKDLNELLYEQNVIDIFGPKIVLALRIILLNEYGGNIRNLLAHGLLDYEELQSQSTAFCWWLVLYLILTHFQYAK